MNDSQNYIRKVNAFPWKDPEVGEGLIDREKNSRGKLFGRAWGYAWKFLWKWAR